MYFIAYSDSLQGTHTEEESKGAAYVEGKCTIDKKRRRNSPACEDGPVKQRDRGKIGQCRGNDQASRQNHTCKIQCS